VSDLPSRLALIGGAIAAGALLTLPLPSFLRALSFERTNFQGRTIATGGGLLFLAAGLVWGLFGPPADRLPTLALVGFGLLGLIDDRWGTAEFKGLRGHLRALASGRVTTGFLKAAGGALLAAGIAWQISASANALVSAPLIALMANLFNLLDLRPLRTLKAFWLLNLGLLGSAVTLPTALLGLSLPYARLESTRRLMLGDVGANGLGAATGAALALALPLPAQAVLVLALASFHAWAEKHSLSAWIARHPWADAIDRWGRGEDPPQPPRGDPPDDSARSASNQ
jgi:UDP-GlcNAc:undecaprenyl-phosphate GlcNAc-1-phosphate transferase